MNHLFLCFQVQNIYLFHLKEGWYSVGIIMMRELFFLLCAKHVPEHVMTAHKCCYVIEKNILMRGEIWTNWILLLNEFENRLQPMKHDKLEILLSHFIKEDFSIS